MNRDPLAVFSITALMMLSLIFTSCGLKPAQGPIPLVTHENNEIFINGEFFCRSESLSINRIDSRVLSMTTDDGYINLDASGNEIKLGDVITNRNYYSVIMEQTAEAGYKLVSKEKKDQSFSCCDLDSFSHMLADV